MINLALSVFAVAFAGALMGFVGVAAGMGGAVQLVSFMFLGLFLALVGSLALAPVLRTARRSRKRHEYDD